MKKILSLLAIAAMVCMAASCNKEKKPKHHDEGDDIEYDAPIQIDGNFADWAALGNKATTCNSTMEEGNDIKQLKVYADEYFIYVYVKLNNTVPDPSWAEGLNHIVIDTFINGDNDIDTGGYIGKWDHNINQGEETISKPCFDVMVYDVIFDKNDGGQGFTYGNSYMEILTWEGEPNTDGWDGKWIASDVEDFAVSNGNNLEYELAICRELYPKGKMADEFTIGVGASCGSWDMNGWLPDAETGSAKPLTVKITK